MRSVPTTGTSHGSGAFKRNTKYSNGLLGVLFFLCTEVALFGSLIFSALYLRRTVPNWPGADFRHGLDHTYAIAHLEWGGLAFANTVFLLTSTVTCFFAEKAISQGKQKLFIGWLAVTIVLGGLFVGGQGWEYAHFHTAINTSIFGASFFTITGLHGIHVTLGVIALTWIFVLAVKGRFTADHYFPVLGVGLYWHFVDIIWVLLYAIFYLT